jgi:hypothetical protein
MDILNLGAGNRIIDGAVNHDIWQHRPEIDVTHDLNVLPWPWDDDSFDNVTAWAVLEHIDITLLDAMNECHRILRPGGTADIKLPWCKCEDSYNDPTHRYVVGLGIFDLFDRSTDRGSRYTFYHDSRGQVVREWKIIKAFINDIGSCVVGHLQAVKEIPPEKEAGDDTTTD